MYICSLKIAIIAIVAIEVKVGFAYEAPQAQRAPVRSFRASE